MARPREFEEGAVLDAAVRCFWSRGYEATSMRELIGETGITGASLYNAFGGKRALYRQALQRYLETSIADRLRRCGELSPRAAIGALLSEIVERSLADGERKGCMLVNAALEVAPHDPEFRDTVHEALGRIEAFFRDRLEAGQADGTIAAAMPPAIMARHLLGVLLGVRVLARVRPDRELLEGALAPAIALLDPGSADVG